MKSSGVHGSRSFYLGIVGLLLAVPLAHSGLVLSGAVESNGEPTGIAITGDVIADHADPDVPDPYTVRVFDEDVLCFTDRDHEYNGATAAGLPDFLIGGDYVMTANNARDNGNYTLDITTAVPCKLYLLRDNRSQGSLPTWFSDGVGLDFTDTGEDVGMDEGGLAAGTVGPGVGIEQTLSVYLAIDPANGGAAVLAPGTYQTLASETTGQNMYGLVAVREDLDTPIRDFFSEHTILSAGETATLRWTISSNATTAVISPGVGDILPATDAVGEGSTGVTPAASTTYTLRVETPSGTNTAMATVNVRLIEDFQTDDPVIAIGDDVLLRWQVRPDAMVSIDGIGDVGGNTDTNGLGTITVNPLATTTYTLRANGSGGAEQEASSRSVFVVPTNGVLVGLIDVGATDGTPDPAALDDTQVGAAPNNTNGGNLPAFNLTTLQGETIGVAVDNLDPTGTPTGRIDWRWRGVAADDALTHTLEDHCKNNGGMIRVSLRGLPAGEYTATSFHYDPGFSQCESIDILVTDMNRTAQSVSPPFASAFANPLVPVDQLSTGLADSNAATYAFATEGIDDVIFHYDGRNATDSEVPFNGLVLVRTGGITAVDPITAFAAEPTIISFGDTSELRWLIASNAISAGIDTGIGDILPDTGIDGFGSRTVMPAVTTTYTLSVSAPGSNDTAQTTVAVRLIDDFSAALSSINGGEPLTLSWSVRPDANLTISGVGDVSAHTDTNGLGSIVVHPLVSTAYTLSATAGPEMELATVTVSAFPGEERFALIDLGLATGQPEPGAAMDTLGNQQIGMTGDGMDLPATPLLADDGTSFTLAVDALDPSGTAVGRIDWRDRGDAGTEPLTRLAEDFFKNNAGMLRVVLGGLPAGEYAMVSYHLDPDNSQSEQIKVWVTDADGVAAERAGVGDASFPGHPGNAGAPGIGSLTESVVTQHYNSFQVRSDGTSDVILYFDGRDAPLDTEVPLNGLEIQYQGSDRIILFNAQFDRDTDSFSFDFNAQTGAVYAVESGADLRAFPDMTNSVITADEDIEHVVVPGIPDEVDRRHYRVRVQTPAP